MSMFTMVVAVILEFCSFVAIGHLWTHKPKALLVSRFLWSLILLIPIIGPLFYVFLRIEPEPHGENSTDGTSGWY